MTDGASPKSDRVWEGTLDHERLDMLRPGRRVGHFDRDVAGAGETGLAGQADLGDEVDVAEVLALVGVEVAEVGLAGEDLDAAQAAGRLADARGRDGDLGAPGHGED